MPAAAVIVPAVAAVAGAVISSRSANKATKAQSQAADAALAFERQKEQQRKAQYDKSFAMWDASRRALAARYGIDLGPSLQSMQPQQPAPQPGLGYADKQQRMAEAQGMQGMPGGGSLGGLLQQPDQQKLGGYGLG